MKHLNLSLGSAVLVLVFLGVAPQAAEAGQRGGLCFAVSASVENNSMQWSCPEVFLGLPTMQQIYAGGFRVAGTLVGIRPGATKKIGNRELPHSEAVPILIIEQQPPDPVCQCKLTP